MVETKETCQVIRKDILESIRLSGALKRASDAIELYKSRIIPLLNDKDALSIKTQINLKTVLDDEFIRKVDDDTREKKKKMTSCIGIMPKSWSASYQTTIKKMDR